MASKSTRKASTPTVPEVNSFSELRTFIEAAASKAGEYPVRVQLSFTSLKGATDLIRRHPRVKGLSALSVKVTEATDTSALLAVSNAGTAATPWPVKATAVKAPAAKSVKASKASKAPAKATAASKAKASKAPAKRASKATAK
jgi:DNA-binding protein HU-beta